MNCTLTNTKVYLLVLNYRRQMAETKGTGGCPWDGKLRRMGPPSSCLSISGISVCAIRPGLRRLEDECPRDGCPQDGRRRRRSKTGTDVPETKGVLLLLIFFNLVESFSGSYCLIIFDDSNGVCGWVCMGACGGAHGRRKKISRGI